MNSLICNRLPDSAHHTKQWGGAFGANAHITIGMTYDIQGPSYYMGELQHQANYFFDHPYILIYDDNKVLQWYSRDLFTTLEEYRTKQIDKIL